MGGSSHELKFRCYDRAVLCGYGRGVNRKVLRREVAGVRPPRATPVAFPPGRTYILTVVQSSRFPLVEALYPVKKPVVLFSLTAASFLPAVARLAGSGLAEPVGLLSDLALGGLVFCLALAAPAWLRVVLVLLWVLFQATAVELFAAMQRLPTWQDLHYLADAEFMRASTAGLKLARPVFVGLQLLAALALCVLPARLVRPPLLGRGLLVLLAVLLVQGPVSRHFDEQPVAARYNPLHWFVEDALLSVEF